MARRRNTTNTPDQTAEVTSMLEGFKVISDHREVPPLSFDVDSERTPEVILNLIKANVSLGAGHKLAGETAAQKLFNLGLRDYDTVEGITEGETVVLQTYGADKLISAMVDLKAAEDNFGRGQGIDPTLWRFAYVAYGISRSNAIPLTPIPGSQGVWGHFKNQLFKRYHEVAGKDAKISASFSSAVSTVGKWLARGIIPGQAYTYYRPMPLKGDGGKITGYRPVRVTRYAIGSSAAIEIWKYSGLNPKGDTNGYMELGEKIAKLGKKRSNGWTVAEATDAAFKQAVDDVKRLSPGTTDAEAKAKVEEETKKQAEDTRSVSVEWLDGVPAEAALQLNMIRTTAKSLSDRPDKLHEFSEGLNAFLHSFLDELKAADEAAAKPEEKNAANG